METSKMVLQHLYGNLKDGILQRYPYDNSEIYGKTLLATCI